MWLVTSFASAAAFSISLPCYRPRALIQRTLGSCVQYKSERFETKRAISMSLREGPYDETRNKPSKRDLIQDFLTQRSIQVDCCFLITCVIQADRTLNADSDAEHESRRRYR